MAYPFDFDFFPPAFEFPDTPQPSTSSRDPPIDESDDSDIDDTESGLPWLAMQPMTNEEATDYLKDLKQLFKLVKYTGSVSKKQLTRTAYFKCRGIDCPYRLKMVRSEVTGMTDSWVAMDHNHAAGQRSDKEVAKEFVTHILEQPGNTETALPIFRRLTAELPNVRVTKKQVEGFIASWRRKTANCESLLHPTIYDLKDWITNHSFMPMPAERHMPFIANSFMDIARKHFRLFITTRAMLELTLHCGNELHADGTTKLNGYNFFFFFWMAGLLIDELALCGCSPLQIRDVGPHS
jgi:hypothetical protein